MTEAKIALKDYRPLPLDHSHSEYTWVELKRRPVLGTLSIQGLRKDS